MRYIIAIFLSVLQASSLVCMVNENNGSHEDHNAPYSQEHEIDWDHIFDDSDDEGIDIFDDLKQYDLYEQENDLFVGDSPGIQHDREDVSEKRYEVHETGRTDCEGTSVVHTTRSGDARNIFGVLSDKDSAFLENITCDERIREDGYQDAPPHGSDLDENYQDTQKKHYIEREYIDRPSLSEIPSENITYDSNKGKYIAVCPVQNCNKTFAGKTRRDARSNTQDHENTDHKKKYVYMCHYCDFYRYRSSAVRIHASRKHRLLQDVHDNFGNSLYSYLGEQAACSSSSDTLPQETDQAGVDRDTNVHWDNSNKEQERQILDYVLQQAWEEYNSAHASDVYSTSHRYTTSSNVEGESGADSTLLDNITYEERIQDDEQRNQPPLGSDVDENYQDTHKSKYIIREYVDRPSIEGVSDQDITKDESDGKYVAQCPVQGCVYTPRRGDKGQLEEAIRIHENMHHANKYEYICRYCDGWSTYNWKSFLDHKIKCHMPCRKKSNTGGLSDREQNEERYKDVQKKNYIEREYIDRPSLSEIPSENITYDSNKGKYIAACPVQNCNKTFEGKIRGDARSHTRDHENTDHKKKYVYICHYCDFYGYRPSAVRIHASRKHRLLQDVHDNFGNSLYSYLGEQAACSSSSDTLPQETDQAGIDRNTNVHWDNSNEEQERQVLDYVLQQAWEEYNSAHASDVYSTSHRYTTSSNVEGESGADSTLLDNITYEERIQDDEQRNEPPLGRGVNENYHENHNAPYSQEYEIDWDHLLDDSDDDVGIFDDLEQHGDDQEDNTFSGSTSYTQYDREDRFNRSHEVYETGGTDCESTSVVHTTRSDDARNISGVPSDKDSTLLENITCDERIREDGYQDAPPHGSDVDENYQDTYKSKYIIREYVDQPSIEGVSDQDITKDESDGKYVAQCPVQGCDYTPRRKTRGQVEEAIGIHENMHHVNRYEYICRFCDGWSTYNWLSFSMHMRSCHSSYKEKSNTGHLSGREQNEERYKDTQKKNCIVREYIDRPSLSQIPSENISYDNNKGKYIVVCPVQNCDKTFEGKPRSNARTHTRDHENADHKKKYVYICHYCDFYGYQSSAVNRHVSRKHQSLQNDANQKDSLRSHTGGRAACSSSSDILSQETDQAGVNSMREYNSAHASEVYGTSHRYTTSSNVAGESGTNKRTRDESETEPRKHMRFQLEDLFE